MRKTYVTDLYERIREDERFVSIGSHFFSGGIIARFRDVKDNQVYEVQIKPIREETGDEENN